MKNSLFALAALTFAAAPVAAQTPAKTLTPPDVFAAAKTIQFTATLSSNGTAREVSTAVLAQPNQAYVTDTSVKTAATDTVYVSDGKTQTEYIHARGRYTRTDAPGQIADMQSNTVALSTLTDFFDAKSFAKFQHSTNDAPGVYVMPLGVQNGATIKEVLAIDPATGLPQSVSVVISPSKNPGVPAEQINFSNWRLNAPVEGSKFAYTPPADAKLYTAPVLLANGTTAPDFTVQDKNGKAVKLSDYRGKTVVLDFWATWCGPCQSSLPHTTAVAKQYADKNVVVLAVNVWDKPAAFQAWLPKHPEYSTLNFAIDPSADQSKSVASALYGVSGIPTQYIIGANGTILKSIVGYGAGDTQLEDTLKVNAK